MENEWRDVPGYEGRYKINISTKEGRCLSTNYRRSNKQKELSSKPDKRGRIAWVLNKYIDGVLKKTTRQAAVWIALTFPELVQNKWFEGAEIDHIDTDTTNNHPSNLRWVNKYEQQSNPLTKEHQRTSAAQRNGRTVGQYTVTGEFIKRFVSICEAAREVKGNDSLICRCCLGKNKTAYGFIWRYI